MEYFAGLDVSMAETHVCVVTRNGAVIHQAKVPSTPADIAAELAQVPTCRRVLFETGRMAPMLYHGLSQLGLTSQNDPQGSLSRNGLVSGIGSSPSPGDPGYYSAKMKAC